MVPDEVSEPPDEPVPLFDLLLLDDVSLVSPVELPVPLVPIELPELPEPDVPLVPDEPDDPLVPRPPEPDEPDVPMEPDDPCPLEPVSDDPDEPLPDEPPPAEPPPAPCAHTAPDNVNGAATTRTRTQFMLRFIFSLLAGKAASQRSARKRVHTVRRAFDGGRLSARPARG